MKLLCTLIVSAWLLLTAVPGSAAATTIAPADRIYRNGIIFTADSKNSQAQAIAIRDGGIVYVGSNQGLAPYTGIATVRVDLKGRFLMPGLVDGHLHPLSGGRAMLKCSLNYESLTLEEFQQRVQACLDKTKSEEPDRWLEVVSWFQESMRPTGVKTSRATLGTLMTKRPIIVRSSFGHTVLANSRALVLAKITAATPDPLGGKIWHDATGQPTGLLEDAAFEVFSSLLPKPTPAQDVQAAAAALTAMNQQGVTSFLDAEAAPEDLASFAALSKAGKLTARAHFAPLIEPTEASTLGTAVVRVLALRKRYDEGAIARAPGITVRNAKLFLDGVIAAPALTGAVLEPYRRNAGTQENPDWVSGTSLGPPVYFPAKVLETALIALGRAGIDPHLHADGDGAVRAALDGIAALRSALPAADIRPAIAHDEIVASADLARFKALNATPVLSLQWGKPAGDTLGLKDYFGPERMKRLEPSGLLAAANARIAFGSDWPVDALDEWFALKVGVTRTNAPDAPAEYRGRLGDDPGLSREAVLRAATINAAYELHQDEVTGSLEVGKLADFIVLDRNPLTVPAENIAKTKVLQTVVGGDVVYQDLKTDHSQLFDPARGVVLTGTQGHDVAEMCGASPNSKSWEVSSPEIESLEQQLAPLLAADLRNTGSKALPRQYYRQYATGQLGKFHAIFVNGFHQGYLSSDSDQSSWRHSAVSVMDGGDGYWCAIYIKETKRFVKYKGDSFGGRHVAFHGVA